MLNSFVADRKRVRELYVFESLAVFSQIHEIFCFLHHHNSPSVFYVSVLSDATIYITHDGWWQRALELLVVV